MLEMKKACGTCRYCVEAEVRELGMVSEVDNWCQVKDRAAPKNACKDWRPRAREEARNENGD
jgi:hypothetical protein